MLTKEEIEEYRELAEFVADDRTATIGAGVVRQLIAHIRGQDAELTSLREQAAEHFDHCIERGAELTSLRETVRFLNDRVREQEATLAKAREFVELTATLTPCTPNQYMRAQTWVKVYDAAHPAPKETP
jgi:hypothetical protein